MENKEEIRKNIQNEKITFPQLAAYGAGGIIPIALFNVAGILVGLMGNISLGLSAFWLGLILIIPRLWDAISDPIIGHLSDNTRTKWGRRRPYLLFGGILVAVFFVIMWWIPKGETVQQWFPTEEGYHTFQLIYILVTLLLFFTAVNLFEIPHGALGMEITNDYHERTRLFSAKSFVGNLFAMSTPWLFALASMEVFKGPGGNEADGMRYVSLMIAALLIPLSFWWFIKLKEPGFKKVEKQEKTHFWQDMKLVVTNKNFVFLTLTIFTLAMGFNFVQLLGSYIPIFYVFGGDKVTGATMLGINGTVWAITGVLAVFPLNWISPRLGKRKTLTIAIILMVIAQLSKIVCYNPDYPYLILIPTILLSAGMLFFFTLGSSMVGDICDEDELRTGNRSEGSYYAVFWWFIKMGTALASFVAGALIVLTMFDESQVTKVDKLQGSLNDFSAKILLLTDSEKSPDRINIISSQIKETLNETKEYSIFLEKELKKDQESKYKNLASYDRDKKDIIRQTLLSVRNTSDSIEVLSDGDVAKKDSLISSNNNRIGQLLLQTKLDKARMNAFELQSHLKDESQEQRIREDEKVKEHYSILIQTIQKMRNTLSNVNIASSFNSLNIDIKSMEKDLVMLKRQTPYTLLMMRIVEIGIPALLSVLSIFFILKYSLTEKRSLEIKQLLNNKNLLNPDEG
jgi:GPH family glycoside/pentoside/hexuronide:cation symporter